VVVGRGGVLLEAEGFLTLRDGLVHKTLLAVGEAEVTAGRGVILVEAKGLVVLGNGFVQAAIFCKGGAEGEVWPGALRAQGQRDCAETDFLLVPGWAGSPQPRGPVRIAPAASPPPPLPSPPNAH